ncbi:MAG: diacylglycerol kinase family protein [Patescibacteria group bacterium]
MPTPFHQTVKSFSNASKGIFLAFRTERSFRVQLFVGLVVVAVSFIFPVTRVEQFLLFLCVGGVLVLELLNSSVERLVDLFKPRLHEYARDVKDLMAGAVLLASICSALIGVAILGPYLKDLF